MLTQMSAAGCSTEEMKDKGNYSSGSTVGHTTYGYSFHGHGPLSSVSLQQAGAAKKWKKNQFRFSWHLTENLTLH